MSQYYNVESEKIVLASILYNPVVIEEINTMLDVEDFYLPSFQNIYRTMVVLYENDKPVEESFIKNVLAKSNQFDEDAFLSMMIATPTTKVESYITTIKELATQRKLLSLANTLRDDIDLHEKINLITAAKDNLLPHVEHKPQMLADAIKELDNRPKKPKYETGLEIVDNHFGGGLELAQLIMLGGEKGAGKTAFALQFLYNISKSFKSCFMSFEMPSWKIAQRAKKANLSTTQLKNMSVLDKGRYIEDIERNMKSLARSGVHFYVTDSLMKIQTKAKNLKRHEEISLITNRLSKLAVELDVIIILIVQVSQENIKSQYMSVKGSGDADYDADIMFFIRKDQKDQRKRYFQCEKNRQNGNEFSEEVYFNPATVSLQRYAPTIYEREYTTTITDEPKIEMEVI